MKTSNALLGISLLGLVLGLGACVAEGGPEEGPAAAAETAALATPGFDVSVAMQEGEQTLHVDLSSAAAATLVDASGAISPEVQGLVEKDLGERLRRGLPGVTAGGLPRVIVTVSSAPTGINLTTNRPVDDLCDEAAWLVDVSLAATVYNFTVIVFPSGVTYCSYTVTNYYQYFWEDSCGHSWSTYQGFAEGPYGC